METTGRVKKWFQRVSPKYLYSFVITMFRCLNPLRRSVIVYPHGDHWRVIDFESMKLGSAVCVPNRVQIMRGKKSIMGKKIERYRHEGFVCVEQGDVVLDIGGFVGEFAIPASRHAKRVICIEPEEMNYRCLVCNVSKISNIKAYNVVAWSKNEKLEFKVARDASDHSIINIDSKEKLKTIEVDGKRMDTYLRKLGVEKIDFVKLDAEGAEPEVLKGLSNIKFDKCAIDCGNERAGESTKQAVSKMLTKWGYVVKKFDGNDVVFANKK